MSYRKVSMVVVLAAVACAGAKEQTRPAAPAPDAPLAQASDPAAQVAPGQAPQDTQQAAPPATTGPGEAGKKTIPIGKEAPLPAAQAAQGAPPPAAQTAIAEAPLMPDAEFRGQKPAAFDRQLSFEAPVPSDQKLKNGARTLVAENHAIPIVAIDVVFLHGIDADPLAKAGLAEFVADMVDEGTKTRTAPQFAEELENLAAQLHVSAGRETTSVHLNCLAETLPKALELLADLVQNPAFRPEDVARVRKLKLTQLQAKRASVGALAGDEANRILYGEKHPWGQPAGGTPETVGRIGEEDLRKFHAAWWVPNNAVVSVAGDVKTADVVKLLDEKLAGWKSRPLPGLMLPKLPKLQERRIIALDKQGTTQSQVWVLGQLFPAREADAIPLRVANTPLGGMFSSRLNLNLREKHGYSYGVGSRVALERSTGAFRAAGGIVAKNTVEALTEYEKEIEKYAAEGPSDEELASAKEAVIRGVPSLLETNDAVSTAMATLVSLELPLTYYKALPAQVRKVTKADAARVAKKWLHPAQWPILIVGPVNDKQEALEKLGYGSVEVRPAVAPDAPVPSAQKPSSAVGALK